MGDGSLTRLELFGRFDTENRVLLAAERGVVGVVRFEKGGGGMVKIFSFTALETGCVDVYRAQEECG